MFTNNEYSKKNEKNKEGKLLSDVQWMGHQGKENKNKIICNIVALMLTLGAKVYWNM